MTMANSLEAKKTASASAEVPRPSRHIPALDGLRGLAVLLVLAFHLAGGAASSNLLLHTFGTINKAGWTGVTLFFLLSGFLITGILWDSKGQPHWWRNFYVRRALRILPLYYGSLVLLVVMAACTGGLTAALKNVWVLFLYLQNIPYFRDFVPLLPKPLIVDHFWTLAVEEQFYILWPPLIALMRTRRQAIWMCLITFALSFFFRIYACLSLTPVDQHYMLLPVRAGELALGGLLAFAYRSGYWPRLRPFFAPTAIIGFIVFAAASWRQSYQLVDLPTLTIGLTAITFAFAALLGMALSGGIVERLALTGWLRWVGQISFGLYVFHVLFLNLFASLAARIGGADHGTKFLVIRLIVTSVGSVALAWLSFHFYETPILKLRVYFAARQDRKPAH